VDGRRIVDRYPTQERFSVCQLSKPELEPNKPPFKWFLEAYFSVIKKQICEADQSLYLVPSLRISGVITLLVLMF
jgi:hypothetical protein